MSTRPETESLGQGDGYQARTLSGVFTVGIPARSSGGSQGVTARAPLNAPRDHAFVDLMNDLRAPVALYDASGQVQFSLAVPLAVRVWCSEQLADARSTLTSAMRSAGSSHASRCLRGPAAYAVRLFIVPGLGTILAFVKQAGASALADEIPRSVTPREREVAVLICEGLSTRELAVRMGISLHTARRHTERVFAKLGVRRRATLIRMFPLTLREPLAAPPHDSVSMPSPDGSAADLTRPARTLG